MPKFDLFMLIGSIAIFGLVLYRGILRHNYAASSASTEVDISQLIDQLTESLERSEEKAKSGGATPRLVVGACDVELSFVLKRTDSSSAKLTAQPVELGGTIDYSKEQVHKLSVHLVPAPDTSGTTPPDPPTDPKPPIGEHK